MWSYNQESKIDIMNLKRRELDETMLKRIWVSVGRATELSSG